MPAREAVVRLRAILPQQLPPAAEGLGAGRPAGPLEPALGDLAQVGQQPEVQVVVRLATRERHRALDLLELRQRPSACGRCSASARVERASRCLRGQRIAARCDDPEHQQAAD